MIKNILLSCIFLVSIQVSYSQVGIGTTTPNASSVLDVSATDKGVLLPRMTGVQRDAIVDPALGLMIYNLDENSLQLYTGSSSNPFWFSLGNSSHVMTNCNANGFEGTYVNGVALTASNTFSLTISNNSYNSTTIGFTTGDLVLSGVSGLSVNSVSPSSATIISGGSQVVEYSLTGTPGSTGTLSGVWTNSDLNCTKTVNVVTGDATLTLPETTVVVSINDGGVDVQGIVDNGSNQFTVNIPYTSGVGTYEAYTGTYIPNNAGTAEGGDANSFRLTYPSGTFSASGFITATIEVDGDGSFHTEKQLFGIQETIAALDFQVNGNSKGQVNLTSVGGILDRNYADANHKFIYLPVVAADGKTWLNNNLGANYSNMNHAQYNPNQQATAFNDYHAYGSLFQWGRYSDGHELINYTNSTTGTAVTATTSSSHSTTITPNNSTFYRGDDLPGTQDNNWLDLGASPNVTEDGLWQGESGANNPCPSGYRLPTETEMNAFVSAEGITTRVHAASSSLALSSSGFRSRTDGAIGSIANYANYWTSTISTSNARRRFFNSGSTSGWSDERATGYGVRCIKD